MVKYEVGIRVGAIQSAEGTNVDLYGYGVYDGYHPCPHLGDHPNPRITLDDNRGVVWGCQCWWGPEEQIKKNFIDGCSVTLVDPKD